MQDAGVDGVAMVLLGNKMDCEEERQVPTEAGRRLAQVSPRTSWKRGFPHLQYLPVAGAWLAQIRLCLTTQPLQIGPGLKPRLCLAGCHLKHCVELADSHASPGHVKNLSE